MLDTKPCQHCRQFTITQRIQCLILIIIVSHYTSLAKPTRSATAHSFGQTGDMIPAITVITSHHPAAFLSDTIAVRPKRELFNTCLLARFLRDVIALNLPEVRMFQDLLHKIKKHKKKNLTASMIQLKIA